MRYGISADSRRTAGRCEVVQSCWPTWIRTRLAPSLGFAEAGSLLHVLVLRAAKNNQYVLGPRWGPDPEHGARGSLEQRSNPFDATRAEAVQRFGVEIATVLARAVKPWR